MKRVSNKNSITILLFCVTSFHIAEAGFGNNCSGLVGTYKLISKAVDKAKACPSNLRITGDNKSALLAKPLGPVTSASTNVDTGKVTFNTPALAIDENKNDSSRDIQYGDGILGLPGQRENSIVMKVNFCKASRIKSSSFSTYFSSLSGINNETTKLKLDASSTLRVTSTYTSQSGTDTLYDCTYKKN